MFIKRFAASQSALWLIGTVMLLACPRQFVGYFGPVLDDGGVVVARLFGAELAALTIVSYFETSRRRPGFARMAWLAYSISNTGGTIVSYTAVRTGTFNAHGWWFVAAYGLYAVVFIAILIRNPGESS